MDEERPVKSPKRAGPRRYSSVDSFIAFENHVKCAQNAYLAGKYKEAEEEATKALRIRPSAQIFALLSLIADSQLQFARSRDFRLLQAFLAHDKVLWEELLHEFVGEEQYYKASVCVNRLAWLEKDPEKQRNYFLQLVDLYIGLNEMRRAEVLLLQLWNKSKCTDFEVFALLSSQFFQLRKWGALQRLIVSSLRSTFMVEGSQRPIIAKTEEEEEEVPGGAGDDDADFNLDADPATAKISSTVSQNLKRKVGGVTDGVQEIYGDEIIKLHTPDDQRKFIILVNVHAELLNECGKFSQTVSLIEFAAACLEVPTVLDLPADLLVRLGTAYAFLGEDTSMQMCRDIFSHLFTTCSIEDYADVLNDAAVTLTRVGQHSDALTVFERIGRYYGLQARQLQEDIEAEERATGKASQPSEALLALRRELRSARTVMVESMYAQADCLNALRGEAGSGGSGGAERIIDVLQHALEVDPAHLKCRLLLGQLLYHVNHDVQKADAVLTPLPQEPAIQTVQLGVARVRMYFSEKMYRDALQLGIPLCEMFLDTDAADGDTASVAPGTRRRGGTLTLPSLTVASSAILPASSLAARSGVDGSLSGSMAGSLAASIQTSSSVFRQSFNQQGRAALTRTAFGTSAAASMAAGMNPAEERAGLKDASAIFQFERRRKSHVKREREGEDTAGDSAEARKQRRVEAVTTMTATEFWEGPKKEATAESADEDVDQKPPKTAEKSVKRVKEADSISPSVGADTLDEDLRALEEVAASGEEGDAPPFAEEIPSLESISKQFSDPNMARLFLEISSNTEAITAPTPLEAYNTDNNTGNTVALGADASPTSPAVFDPKRDRVSFREVLQVISRSELVALIVRLIDSYTALHRYADAQHFAAVTLGAIGSLHLDRSWRGGSLLRPVRLAVLRSAVASREGDDVFRVGLRLLQEDASDSRRLEVLELLNGMMPQLNSVRQALFYISKEGDKKTAFTEENDMGLIGLIGNRNVYTRSYVVALQYFLWLLQQRPQDIYVNFMVGLCYLFCSHQKRVQATEACISAAIYYLKTYQQLAIAADPERTGEALYNTARCFHYLRLYNLCIPIYEEVAYRTPVPSHCSRALQRAAQYNLYFYHRWVTGNRSLALVYLPSADEK